MNSPLLSVIIVDYKSKEYLDSCLQSIIGDSKNSKTQPLTSNTEVIVVNNNENNIGYGAGCNKGARKAKGKYLFFLNPDSVVLDNSLKKMIDFMQEHPEIGVLGPRLYNSEKKDCQLSFCRFPDPLTSIFVFSPLKSLWKENPFWKRYIYSKKLNSEEPVEVDTISGAAILVRKDIFKRINGFDEGFFLYFEENDLCKRIKKLNKKIVFYPNAEIVHFGGKSTAEFNDKDKVFRQSRLKYFKKYYPFPIPLITEGIIRMLEKISEIK